jgi:hypothetical protein
MSDFRYHYLLVSLYVFAISIVIVENDLEIKLFMCCTYQILYVQFFFHTIT